MLHAVSNPRSDDLVIALVSGGGSALLTLPAGNMSLADKQLKKAFAAKRCNDRRDECGSQTSLGHQRRSARRNSSRWSSVTCLETTRVSSPRGRPCGFEHSCRCCGDRHAVPPGPAPIG